MQTEQVTMASIAKALNLSASTVSRALRNDRRIRREVVARVRAAADAMGYTPNPLVQALMSQRRRRQPPRGETIALVTACHESCWRQKDVCRWYLAGMAERAARLGYALELFPLPAYHGGGQRLREILVARGIRGAVLGFSAGESAGAALDVEGFCVVGLSTYFEALPVDRVQLHGFYNVKLAFARMRGLGYTRPALVAPVRNNAVVGGQWSAAALDEQWQRPERERCPPLMTSSADVDPMQFRAWFERHRPDAVLAYKVRVLDLMARLGIRVPGNAGVAHLFGTERERRSMAGIDGHLERVGAAAVDLLVQKLHLNETGLPAHPREVLIKGSWQDGPTIPRCGRPSLAHLPT